MSTTQQRPDQADTSVGGRHAATTREVVEQAPPLPSPYADLQRLASYQRTAPRPPAATAGAWIVLLVGLSVTFAEWALYPMTVRGQIDANWALGFMIISTAGALRILVGNPGRHMVSVVAILVAGLGFVLRAFLVTRDPSAIYAFQLACGALLLLGGLMALVSPTLEVDPPADIPQG